MSGGAAAGLAGGAGLDLGQRVVLGDEDGEEESEDHGAGSEQEGGARDERLLQRDGKEVNVRGLLDRTKSERTPHLGARRRSARRRIQVVQLHVEQEEDEAVESRTQTGTQTSDTRDHPLNHTWTRTTTRCSGLNPAKCQT